MNVAELIERLQEIEDKTTEVCFKDCALGNAAIGKIEIEHQLEVKVPGRLYVPEKYFVVLVND